MLCESKHCRIFKESQLTLNQAQAWLGDTIYDSKPAYKNLSIVMAIKKDMRMHELDCFPPVNTCLFVKSLYDMAITISSQVPDSSYPGQHINLQHASLLQKIKN